ncbi:hypothetical protein AS033_03215 [Exiguobacterium indicum]|uniref:Uncharacterized protein n=1 Tax=Exiguobacterium indicum TaxID=296995 RepID=A0A0V8GJE3_9BACL|nr:ankyrin repeat domain-containing protein [Exiguobacterium enclense]KSU50405.1 hypothetical protein AS033_03215 [Exiguobacterium enclense]
MIVIKKYLMGTILLALLIVGGLIIYQQMKPFSYDDLAEAIQQKDSERIKDISQNINVNTIQREKLVYDLNKLRENQAVCRLLNSKLTDKEYFWKSTLVEASLPVLECWEKDWNLYRIDSKGNGPLHFLTSPNVERERWKYILNHSNKKVINQCNNIGETPLVQAARNGNEVAVRELLNQGANVNGCQIKPIQAAVEQGNRNMYELLKEHGASIPISEIRKISRQTGLSTFNDLY